MREEWKVIPGYPDYEVSDQGRVRSWKRWNGHSVPRLLTPSALSTASGRTLPYLRVSLTSSTRVRVRYVHSLVLESFVGACPAGMEARHLDGDCQNNTLNNLQWGLPKANYSDRRLHGTDNTGNKNGRAILSEEDVKNIRRRYKKNARWPDSNSSLALGMQYGVDRDVISAIARERLWAHVD